MKKIICIALAAVLPHCAPATAITIEEEMCATSYRNAVYSMRLHHMGRNPYDTLAKLTSPVDDEVVKIVTGVLEYTVPGTGFERDKQVDEYAAKVYRECYYGR